MTSREKMIVLRMVRTAYETIEGLIDGEMFDLPANDPDRKHWGDLLNIATEISKEIQEEEDEEL